MVFEPPFLDSFSPSITANSIVVSVLLLIPLSSVVPVVPSPLPGRVTAEWLIETVLGTPSSRIVILWAVAATTRNRPTVLGWIFERG